MPRSAVRGAPVHRLAGLALTGAAVFAACRTSAPSASAVSPAVEVCVDLATSQAAGLSWSQRGKFLGIGTIGPDGSPGARVLDAEGRSVGAAIDRQDLVPSSVVVTAEGRLAWLERRGATTLLVEDRADGIAETALPAGIDGLGWTAVGFALLEHPAGGGSRILNLDVDRPDEPTVSYATDLFVERFWIPADPEGMVLTIVHPDHRDAPASFLVVGSDVEHQLTPAGADTSGASMPGLGRWVVYRSTETSRMEAIRVSEPARVLTLSDRLATRGQVSDPGILAFVPVEPYGQVCLVDVAASIP